MVETFWDLSGRPSDCCRLTSDNQRKTLDGGSAPKAVARSCLLAACNAAIADVRAVYCCGPHCASKWPFVLPQGADRVPRSRSSAGESASDFGLSVDNSTPSTGRDTAWQSASTEGTQATAKRRFDGQARLAAGMRPVAAAPTHECSAQAFRIGAVLAAKTASALASHSSGATRTSN